MTRSSRRGLLAALAVALPVLVGVGYSVLASVGLTGPGAAGGGSARLVAVLGEPVVWAGLAWSLWVAAASTALAAAGAVAVAALFRRGAGIDRMARLFAVLPLPIPHLAAAVAGLLLLGQSGLLARLLASLGLLADPGGMPALVYDRAGLGLILTLAWKEFAFLALVAFSVVATRGERLEEVARTLGAKPAAVFRRVTWPLLWRGILPAVVAAFVFVASTYEATAVLAPSDPLALPLLTLERYTDADLSRRGDAFALALLGMTVSLLAVAAHEWARSHWDRFEP
ncbi:MAG: ABC transporter permease subunit [Gemmatimonadales bacterium]|nr:ABC transporter permease subunit [Gemmatimonadales bacterium]